MSRSRCSMTRPSSIGPRPAGSPSSLVGYPRVRPANRLALPVTRIWPRPSSGNLRTRMRSPRSGQYPTSQHAGSSEKDMLSMNTSSPLSSRCRKKPGVKRYFVTTAHSTGPNNVLLAVHVGPTFTMTRARRVPRRGSFPGLRGGVGVPHCSTVLNRCHRGCGPISVRIATDLEPDVDRSRRGLRPISSRKRTDLGECGVAQAGSGSAGSGSGGTNSDGSMRASS